MFSRIRRVLLTAAASAAVAGWLVAGSSVDAGAASSDPLAAAAAEALEHIAAHEARPAATVRPTSPESVEQSNALLAVADLVAGRMGVDPSGVLEAWSGAGRTRVKVTLAALAHVGDPYEFGVAGPDAFDCSGLSVYAWASVGVQLPHQSRRQIDAVSPRSPHEVLSGDLVWRPGHVMVALGFEDLVVNAVEPGTPVTVKRWGTIERIGSPLP